MKTITVGDDIYDHLLKNVSTIGEDASSILRRLLHVPQNHPVTAPHTTRSGQPEIVKQGTQAATTGVAECLTHSRFHVEREAVGRFLFVLGWLHQRHPDKFHCVLDLCGRKRKYFAHSADELEASGESVNAQRVPDSKYWVITNNDTPKKKRILADVMRLLGYAAGDIDQMAPALD
jgi:negative modulator of initiation of replication